MRVGLCAVLPAAAILHALGTRAGAAEATIGVTFQDHTYFHSDKIGGTTPPLAGYFTIAFPLMIDTGSQTAAGKAIKAKF